MIQSAKEFWKEKFEEYPKTDADNSTVAMMAEYAIYLKEILPNADTCSCNTALHKLKKWVDDNYPNFNKSDIEIKIDELFQETKLLDNDTCPNCNITPVMCKSCGKVIKI